MGNNVYKDLHNLDHVDSSFSSVDNDFVYPEEYSEVFGSGASEYQESIQMFIIMSAVFGCLGILIIGIVVICINFIRGKDDDGDDDSTVGKVAKYSRWGISILIFVSLVMGVVYAFTLDSSIQDVQDTMNESYTPFGNFIDDANKIQGTMGEMVTLCGEIEDASSAPISTAAAQIASQIVTAQGYMTDFLTDAGDISWEDSGDGLNSPREAILYVCLGITVFLLVLVILSLLTSQRKDCCGCTVSICVLFGMLLVWVIASLQFGISVEVADICADPNDAAVQAVSSSFDGLAGNFNDTILMLEYYVYCDDDHTENPLIDAVDETIGVLGNLSSTITLLETYANGTSVEDDVDELAVAYNKTVAQTDRLAGHLDCEEINGYYNDIVDEFCGDLLDGWYGLYVAQWVTVGLLLLRFCVICRGDS